MEQHIVIASTDAEGKKVFMGADESGKLYITKPENQKHVDFYWYLIPVADELDTYFIVSSEKNLALYHHPSSGNKVKVVPINYYKGKHSKWKLSNGDIYQQSKDGTIKTLWFVDGKLYVSPDPIMATKWETYEPDIIENYCSASSCGNSWVWVFLFVILIVVLFALFYKKA